jgi:hypothetical protein
VSFRNRYVYTNFQRFSIRRHEMFSNNSSTLVRIFIAITLFISFFSMETKSKANTDPLDTNLFLEISPDTPEARALQSKSVNNNKAVIRHRLVKVNFDLVTSDGEGPDIRSGKGHSLSLNLFQDTIFNAVLDKVETGSDVDFIWNGYIEGIEFSNVNLVFNNNTLTGLVTSPKGIFEIHPAGNDIHDISEVDQSAFPNEADPYIGTNSLNASSLAATSSSNEDDGSTIDVLVVFTEAARKAAGDSNAINSLINLAVSLANTTYSNSGINQRVRLVHTEEVSYTESGKSDTDVNRLVNPSDNFMDDVPTLRDMYSADIVVLILESLNYCGQAYEILNPVSTAFASNAYLVVKRDCATGNLSFAHELGHIMGARHDWYADSTDNSPYTYNHGYVNVQDNWRTVMAYDNECRDNNTTCTRLQFWSNPDINYNNDPMGVSEGQTHAADNRKTLNNTASTVAKFRQSNCPLAGGVILYWNKDFDCINTAGDPGYRQRTITGWENIEGAFNEKASSIKVPKGWSVGLYEKENRGGDSVCKNSDDSDFAGETFVGGIGLNDQVSSFEVFANNNCGRGPTVDVVLIIDSSGSMSWNDPYRKRLDAAKAYLTASVGGDYVGVVDFNGYAKVDSPLLKLPDNKLRLISAIDTIGAYDGTNIGEGLKAGCSSLLLSSSMNSKKGAILLTDGVGYFSGEDSCFKNNGWPVYTFGFGDADDALLQQIAQNTGGEYKRLPTSNLVCEFQQVRTKISGVQPGPCTAIHISPLENISTSYIVLDNQSQATFSSSWTGSDIVMTLKSPSGRVIDRNTSADDVAHDLGATYEVYKITNPEAGNWEVNLYGGDVPPGGEDVTLGFTTIPSENLNLPPELVIPGIQEVQYSDSLSFTVSATDPDNDGTSLVFSSISSNKDLVLTDNGDGTATVSGIIKEAPGTYDFVITVTDPEDATDTKTISIVVNKEDARTTYTGPMLVSTPCEDCSEATVPLRATIQDITAVTSDPAFDPDAGDITNASVTFVNRDNADAVLCATDVVLLDTSDPTTGTATCDWQPDIGNNDGLDFTVGIVVGSYYTRNSSEDNTVVVVSKPSNNFITGGGYLINQNSEGAYNGNIGLKTNFGFNVKFNKKLTNLQGRVTIIVRKVDHVYQIKSNQLSSLVVKPFDENDPDSGTAELFGKANIQDVTDPDNPVSIEGNATLQMVMKDNGEPGSEDTLGITLWSKNGDLLFSSNWSGVETFDQILDGGNLRVH